MDSSSKHTPVQRYELCERIAVGGMAEVFRAKSYGAHGFAKVLAIKRILPALAADPEFERRFIAEAKLAVGLSHANIVQVLDFSRFGRSLYIVMEYVEGGDLQQVLQRSQARGAPLPLDTAMHIAIELLRGLEFAHARGVVHRDISPSNILLSRAGEVKIADFGIARAGAPDVGRALQIMGKWRYMSPEQTRGEALGSSSDVFSAATVLFEVFTGERLFAGAEPEEIVRAIRRGATRRPSAVRGDLPPELDAPLAAALALDAGARIDCATLLHAVAEVCYARSLPAMPIGMARYLAGLLPPRTDDGGSSGAPPGTAGGSGTLLDQILSSEGVIDAGASRPAEPRPKTRVTLAQLTPPALHPDDEVDDTDGPDAGAATSTTMTLIHSEPGADGVPRWRLEDGSGTDLTAAEIAGSSDPPTPAEDAPTTAFDLRRPIGQRPWPPPDAHARGDRRSTGRRILQGRPWPARIGVVTTVVLAGITVGVRLARDAPAGGVPGMRSPDPIEPLADRAPPPRDPIAATTAEPIERTTDDPRAHAPMRTSPRAATRPAGRRDRARRRGPARREDGGHEPQTTARTELGTIDLFCDPWADVYYRGEKIATAPQRAILLPLGRQELTLVNPVLKRRTTLVVDVPSDRPIKVSLTQPSRP